MMQMMPTSATTSTPWSMLPFVRASTLPPLMNTPEPMTMPMTIEIAVGSPYRFSIVLLSIPSLSFDR